MAVGTLTKWDDEGSYTQFFTIATKAYDFGTSSEYKKVSKLFVTVSNSSQAQVSFTAYYRTNLTSGWTDAQNFTSLSGSDTEQIHEITFSPPIKCKVIQFSLRGMQPFESKEFYVNDISVIYRPLRDYSTERFISE